MKNPSKEDIMKKWSSILEPMGLTGAQLDNLPQLVENQSNHILEENTLATESTSIEFPSLLPMAMKVAAKTISQDLIFASKEEIDAVKSRVQSENRDSKIEAIIEGGEFIEKKLEDDEEYQKLSKKGVTPLSAPLGQLFYIDYKYDGNLINSTSPKKTRRAGKKHKKNG